MEANPYQSPAANLDTGDRWSLDLKQLWKIALYQKFLMGFQLVLVSISLFMIFYVQFVVTMMKQGIRTEGIWFWTIIVSFTISLSLVVICITAITYKCWHPGVAVFTFLGMLVPALNLILLLSINALVTHKLRKYSIQVGLFGANMNDIRNQLKEDADQSSHERATQAAIPIES